MRIVSLVLARLSIVLAVCVGVAIPAHVMANAGAPASVDFTLESSSGGQRSLSHYRGRVAVLFYEDRHHTDTNARVKEAVARYGMENNLQEKVSIVAVANLKGYDFVPASTFARKAIQSIAARHKVEILMDWRGVVIDKLGVKDSNANIVVLDRNGGVRFRATGRLNDEQQKALLAAVQASL
jgi:predicted transcriptional regulator